VPIIHVQALVGADQAWKAFNSCFFFFSFF